MPKTEKKTSSFNIPINLRKKLEREATQVKRSMSAQLSLILEDYFNSQKSQPKETQLETEKVGISI